VTEQNEDKGFEERSETAAETAEEIEVLDAEDAGGAGSDSNGTTAADEHLKEIETLKNEKQELEDRLLRQQAEFDNFRKRTQKEKEADRKYKAQDIASDLLPIVDNFHRALQTEVDASAKNFAEGVEMVYRQLQEALKNHGIEEIETVGQEFDPNLHHAVLQEEDPDKASNLVVEELQKGYRLKDRVIRPAMVKVNK